MTVDRIPTAGETLIGWDYRETYGGKGSDMAVQAARLGAEVSYIGVVGEDAFGKEFIELMKSEKVDTKGIRQTKAKSTGVGFIIKDNLGSNLITVDMGANEEYTKEDIDKNIDLIKESDVVLAQIEIPIDTALDGLKRAKELGKTTIFNPAPAQDLIGYDLSFIDILTPNETEAKVMIGESPEVDLENRELVKKILKAGCKTVVITLGEKGVDIHNEEGAYHVDSFKVDVVDSNGAGDSFNAALAVAVGEGKSLEEAVKFGNAVAGLCCTKWETVPSYHDRSEVEEFLKN